MNWLRLFFGFKGRINRAQYWGAGILANVVIYAAMFFVAAPLAGAKSAQDVVGALIGVGLLVIPLSILSVWTGLAIQVKRLHDRNRSGWMSLLMFVPMFPAFSSGFAAGSGGDPAAASAALLPMLGLGALIGLGFFIDLGCLPGTPGPNKYGDPPGAGMGTAVSPVQGGAPDDRDAPAAPSRLQGAEEALARAIEERRKSNVPISHPDRRGATVQPSPRAAPAMARPAPAAAPAGFGRRGL